MSTKSVTEKKPNQEPLPSDWSRIGERAPSAMRTDEPRVARTLGLCGLMLLTLGSLTLAFHFSGRGTRFVGPGLGSFFAVVGLGLMLFHAARDADLQVRRLYGLFGALWLLLGISSILWPTTVGSETQIGTYFLPYGIPCLGIALLFLLPFARNETEPRVHNAAVLALGLVGAAAALAGFIGGSIPTINFLVPLGLLLTVLGLGYLWTFVALHGSASDIGYRAGLAIGALGLVVFLVALGWSALPPLFASWGWLGGRPEPYLIPRGLLLMTLGLVYLAVSAGLSTDNRLVVLTRRELAAFFYSPIAYIVLFGFTAIAWWQYSRFLQIIATFQAAGEPLAEPVISYYIIDWPPVISMIAIVPLLTMRLLSEEKRSGTMEVLLTAPLDETSVVASKFLASLIFFLVLWVPWGLFLVALRIQGGEPFDYRPLLSFFFALASTGAGLLGMGLFFSSLTRNQISAFILTFVAVVPLTFIFFLKRDMPSDSAWRTIFTHICYVDFWIESLEGKLSLRYLLFHLSAAVFWLFLTVKVLEARKWS